MSFKDFFTIKETKNNKFREAINGYARLKPKNFKTVYSADMSIVQIFVCVENIIDYVKLMDFIIGSIKTDTELNKYQIPFNSKLMYVSEFFLDNKKYTIDTFIHSTTFIERAIKLLEIYELKENELNKSFITEKNLFLTQNLINNIIEIQKEFTNVFK